MSTALILALLAIAICLLAVVLASRSGPRVTTIETRHDKRDGGIETRRVDDPSDDQPKAD